MPSNEKNAKAGWLGWIYFAGILMILSGVSDAFLGITALVNHHYVFITSTTNNLLVTTTTNVTTWGWLHLAIGLLVVAAGFSLLHGNNWARIFAIIFMGFAFIENMVYLSVYPIWAIVAMVVNVVVIYALIVNGRDFVE